MNLFTAARHVLLLLLAMQLAACAHPFGGQFSDPLATITGKAEKDNAKSQLYLAHLLEEGAGMALNVTAAASWYSKSIALGNPEAAYGLAGMHLAGTAIPENDSEAVRLLFVAAEKGEGRAQVQLGGLYLTGKAKAEFVTQVNRNQRGAAQGDMRAMYNLGWMSREGAGIPRSMSIAQGWLTKSAERGFAPAARLLGDILSAGDGVPKDVSAALHWYGVGAARGDRPSLRHLAELNKLGFVGSTPVTAYTESQPDEESHAYYQLQMDFISKTEKKDPDVALTAVRRLTEQFPADNELLQLETRLWEFNARRLNPLALQAEQALANGDLDTFRNRLGQIMSAEFKEQQLRDLSVLYWRRADTEARRAEKARKRDEIREERREEKREEQAETPDSLLKKGQVLLDGGKFDEASRIFGKLTRIHGNNHIASAYVYLGIATLVQINPAKVSEAKKLRLNGMKCFQNALRFDRTVTLPAGYGKYRDLFAEAMKQLK